MGRRSPLASLGAATLVLVLLVSGAVLPRADRPGANERSAPSLPAARAMPGPPRMLAPLPMHGSWSAAAGGEGRVLATTTDGASVPNSGLRLNVTDFVSNPLPANSAYQIGVEEVIGGYEAVFGLFANPSTSAVPFFSVFTNLTDQDVHLAYWTNLTLIAGTSYDFELVHTNGTNWTLTVNGALFASNRSAGVFDFGTSSATWLSSIGFSQIALFPANPSLPPAVTVPLAMAVLRGGSWYLPAVATASFSGSPSAQWGIEGRAQHPTLAPGELETGSQIANVTNATVLWSGGPVPVRVGLTFAAPAVVATVPVVATVIVTAIGGAPIPGVTVSFRDAHSGAFAPTSAFTNGSGGGSVLFETPNVSAALADPVTANVTLFGYVGEAVASIDLSPPTQLFLQVAPAAPVVPPNGEVQLVFRAVDASGATVAGAFLAFSVSGSATIYPPSAVTDGSGTAVVNVSVGPVATQFTLTGTVTGVGKWGSTQVVVTIRATGHPASLLTKLTPYLLLVAVGVVVGLLAFLLARRRRKRPIPSMALKQYARRARGPGGSAPAPSDVRDPSTASRTPPSASTP